MASLIVARMLSAFGSKGTELGSLGPLSPVSASELDFTTPTDLYSPSGPSNASLQQPSGLRKNGLFCSPPPTNHFLSLAKLNPLLNVVLAIPLFFFNSAQVAPYGWNSVAINTTNCRAPRIPISIS